MKPNYFQVFSSIKFNVLGSWADTKINNDMLAILYTSTKTKIKNSHFRYSTVDFRYTTSITSGSQPRTITSGLRIRFSTSGSLYLVSNYGITSGLQYLISNYGITSGLQYLISNYGITSGFIPCSQYPDSNHGLTSG